MKLASIMISAAAAVKIGQQAGNTNLLERCDGHADFGNFEGSRISDLWYAPSSQNGSIALTTADSYDQETSLEAFVSGGNGVKFMNKNACRVSLTEGTTYRVAFYLKGSMGSKVKVELLKNYSAMETAEVEVLLDEWKWYVVNLTATQSTD